MKAIVELDDDVVAAVVAAQGGLRTFDQAVNNLIRRGLMDWGRQASPGPFFQQSFDMGVKMVEHCYGATMAALEETDVDAIAD